MPRNGSTADPTRLSAWGGKGKQCVAACLLEPEILMRSPEAIFREQFVPAEHGYVFYPSLKSGGKYVSPAERDRLISRYQRLVSPVHLLVLPVIFFGVVEGSLWLGRQLDWPFWSVRAVIVVTTLVMLGIGMWVAFSPHWLVRNRPDIMPARPTAEVWRETRDNLTWPFVILVTAVTGAVFIWNAVNFQPSISSWVWLLASGYLLLTYLRLGFQKLRDPPNTKQ